MPCIECLIYHFNKKNLVDALKKTASVEGGEEKQYEGGKNKNSIPQVYLQTKVCPPSPTNKKPWVMNWKFVYISLILIALVCLLGSILINMFMVGVIWRLR